MPFLWEPATKFDYSCVKIRMINCRHFRGNVAQPLFGALAEYGSYQEHQRRKCECRLSAFQFNSSSVLAKTRKDEVVKPPPYYWMPQLQSVTPRQPHPSWATTTSPSLLLSHFPRLMWAQNSAVETSSANGNHAQATRQKSTQTQTNSLCLERTLGEGGDRQRRKRLLRAAQHPASRTTDEQLLFFERNSSILRHAGHRGSSLLERLKTDLPISQGTSPCAFWEEPWSPRSAGSDLAAGTSSSSPRR